MKKHIPLPGSFIHIDTQVPSSMPFSVKAEKHKSARGRSLYLFDFSWRHLNFYCGYFLKTEKTSRR